MKNYSQFKKGFGILEVLVSAVIIITILMALVFIGQTAMANSVYTQQRAQATFLAQEGIEQVRQIRDTNWIDRDNTTEWNTLAWDTVASDKVLITVGDYKFDSPANPFHLISFAGTEESINIDSTNYKRKVTVATVAPLLPNDAVHGINDVEADINALKITVNVSWNSKAGDKSISASEVITNWRPNY